MLTAAVMDTVMTIMTTDMLSRLRLLQLVSPSLPVGGFSYSQGLEWAVETGWVHDTQSLTDWLEGLIGDGIASLDIPILVRMHRAVANNDVDKIKEWSALLFAHRETRELREEEQSRAKALTRLLIDLQIPNAREWKMELSFCQAAPFALAAEHWGISIEDSATGYAWNWLENQIAAAIKLVPLGQTDGQRVHLILATGLPKIIESAIVCPDDEIGSGAPALAMASARHETQYTRLFRS